MPTERDIERIWEVLLALRDDMVSLKTWRDNQNAKTDSTARWAIALLSAGIALASLLLNYWVYVGGGH